MDIELLKTFLAVSQQRHFGRAADTLYLTQSAVSFRIKQLEQHLGTELFIRQRNNICLTPAGNKFIPYAEHILQLWLNARQEISQNNIPEISIGASPVLWETYLTPFLAKLYAQHSNLKIIAKLSSYVDLIQQLSNKQLNMFITNAPPSLSSMNRKLIGKVDILSFHSAHNPEKNERPYLHLEWDQQRHTINSPSYPNPILQTSSAHLIKDTLHTLGGYALLPKCWAKKDPKLLPDNTIPPIIISIYAVWLRNSIEEKQICDLLESFMAVEEYDTQT